MGELDRDGCLADVCSIAIFHIVFLVGYECSLNQLVVEMLLNSLKKWVPIQVGSRSSWRDVGAHYCYYYF